MAIVFELWAECRTDSECAALVRHFDGLRMPLLTGRTISWRAGEADCSTALLADSLDLSSCGNRTLQDTLESTESGIRLYHHLKNGPAFRFARVAWEAQNIPLSDLHDYVTQDAGGQRHFEIECVVDEELYRQLGSPRFCYPFRAGYWWTRYHGERYHPLFSNDQKNLNTLCQSLFPDYFKH